MSKYEKNRNQLLSRSDVSMITQGQWRGSRLKTCELRVLCSYSKVGPFVYLLSVRDRFIYTIVGDQILKTSEIAEDSCDEVTGGTHIWKWRGCADKTPKIGVFRWQTK